MFLLLPCSYHIISINVILRLLKAVDFVVVVANVFVVVVVVNVIVVALIVVTGHNIQLLSTNINLRLLKATLSFCGGWVGVLCTIIFKSNPTTVLRLRCVVVGVVTKM